MTNENTDRYLEDYVNELAVEYYYAKKKNDKPAELRASSEMMRCITKPCVKKDMVSSPYKKTISKIIRYGLLTEKDDIINEALFMSMTKYKPVHTDENGENKEYMFFPYYMKALAMCCNEKLRKKKDKECYESISLDYDPSENETGEHNTYVFIELDDKKANIEENIKTNERCYEIAVKFTAVITKFYEHNNTGVYAKIRLSYFRIFYTEHLIVLISKGFIKSLNKTEAYECSDQELVRFVSFSDYKSLDDLVYLKFKKISDIFPEDKKSSDNPVKVPCENRVIADYRSASKLDASRTSDSNVSQQRKHYKKALAVLFEDLK